MIDIKLIRDRPEFVQTQLARKGYLFLYENLLNHDRWMRDCQEIWETYRQCRKELSSHIGGDKALLVEWRGFSTQLKELEKMSEEPYLLHKKRVDEIMMRIPNLPHESVPGGAIPYHTMVT